MTTQTLSAGSPGARKTRTSGDLIRQLLVILSLAGVIVVNGLANALPINGQATGDISDRFQVFFVPEGYVFSIWGVIYLALIAYAIYQAVPAQATNPILRSVGYAFILSCGFNVAWLFLWHYEFFVWTLVAMVGLLLTLILIYVRIGSGERPAGLAEYWLLHFPFSIYLGWITVATIANATSLLDYLNWSGWGIGPAIWAVIMLAIATVVGVAIGAARGDIAYVGVLVWAFVGIAVKHWDTPLVAYSALAAAGIVAASLLIGVPRRRQRLKKVGASGRTADDSSSAFTTTTA